ncbi:hypothetical protein [Streptomyces sp. PSAA01]|uniref:hypothetical protein n=1 Tax=Streptomyces sp. PSAA01 TaxID=2912762 RepID=UPI001F2117DC|nr:hypothetical protein [Streptomyces sp. PSAA01]MCG0290330.1 hypothetical protein [Streptomyces sp. PSAA01]
MNNPIHGVSAWVSAFLALRPRGRHRSGATPLAPRAGSSRPKAGYVDFAARAQPVATSPEGDVPTPGWGTAALPLDDQEPASVPPRVVVHEQRRIGAIPRVELVCAPHGMVVIR